MRIRNKWTFVHESIYNKRMTLSLHRLRTLREVARVGGIIAAAATLHYSPSTVSQQLETLSRDIGAPVLERVGRGVRLTDVGRIANEYGKELLEAEQRTVAAIEQARQGLAARLTIGVFATAAASLLPAVFQELAQRYPEIIIESEEVGVEDAVEGLRDGRLDCALMLDYPDAPEQWSADLSVVPIGIDEIHLAAPAGSGLGQEVSLTEMAGEDWILSGTTTYYGRAMRTACRAAGFEPVVRHRLDGASAALALVAAGLGVTFTSDLAKIFSPLHSVETIRLAKPLQNTIVIVQLPHTAKRPTVRAVHSAFHKAGESLGLRPPIETHSS
ncbi:MAG: LysR substrate-binding domain-containing protein [Brevibacterium sp.]|nr:LysR substrate-binding domain-containing protein [Brevibacterium sp.]